MRRVFLAARVFFGRASAAAPTPATWISLRRERVIAVRSFSFGGLAKQHERAAGADQSTREARWQLRVAPDVCGGYRFSGVLPIAAGPLSWSAISACFCSWGSSVSIRLQT